MGQNQRKEGEIPEEILSSNNLAAYQRLQYNNVESPQFRLHLVEGHEDEGLTEHGEDDVVDPVELGCDDDEEDELGEEGDEVKAGIIVLHGEVEQVEIHTEVVPDVLPSDVVEVSVLQEVLAVHVVAEPGEEREGEDGADHQPQPGHVDVQQRPQSCLVGEGDVEGETVDDGVDLQMDGQAVHHPRQYEDLLLVEVDGEEDQGHND